jgi:hypothetical protein
MHLHSFWWRVIKRSFKDAWEPFESFGRICALIAGMVAVGFITHLVTQEWGDYMIYWTIAFPVVVWWVWFFWHLIKVPHQIHEEDLAAANLGPMPKSISQNYIRFIFVVVVVSGFMGLLAAKNWQISQLRKELPTPMQNIAAKALPDKIIPQPVISNAPPIVSTPQVANVESPIQFETNNPST